jgi:predicted ATPase
MPAFLPRCCRFQTMDDHPALDLTPQQRRERTVDALTTQLMSLTNRHPVLMIHEDAHWSDPSTLEGR